MDLTQLVKPIEEMSTDELMDRLRAVRARREVIRPAARKHEERAETKVSRNRVSKANSQLEKLLANLSPDELKTLLEQHGEPTE